MKKFFLWLLIAVLLVSLAGCKDNQQQLDGTNNTLNTKATQNTATENKEIENTKNTEAQQNPATEATENGSTLNTESQQNPPTEATDSESKEKTLYVIREITDHRVKIENNKKIYNDDFFFSLTFPMDWKCLEQQGEDGCDYYFRDPVLGENCQFSLYLTGAEFLYERTPEQYQEDLSRSHQDLVIDSITKETIQGYQCTKVVYSYTKDEAKFINIWYSNLTAGFRLYNFSIIYPADQKDTYKPTFAAMMDSLVLK